MLNRIINFLFLALFLVSQIAPAFGAVFIDSYAYAPAESLVTSIQEVTITIGSGSTSNTATITGVNTSYASVIYQGQTSSATSMNFAQQEVRAELTNSTTVTAYRNTSTTNTPTIHVVVIEWRSSSIQSIQGGTVTASGATGTATISSVTTANAAIFYIGATTVNSTDNSAASLGYVSLTDATTVTLTRRGTNNSVTAGFFVVEFKSGVLASSVQSGVITITAGNTSNTATTSSLFSYGKAIVVYNGVNTSNSSTFRTSQLPYLSFDGLTTVTATRVSSTNIADIAFNIIEFKSTDVAAATFNETIVITGAVTSAINGAAGCGASGKTTLLFTGNTATDSVNPSRTMTYVSLPSPTYSQADRNTADASLDTTSGINCFRVN